MEKIISDWKNNSVKDEEKNYLYIRSLKMKDSSKVDRVAKDLHEEAFKKIDCLKCGNCCKTIKPILKKTDIKNISNHLDIPIKALKTNYLDLDEDGDWTFNALPCPFLGDNNVCEIYESRPKACRKFPHTSKSGFAFRSYQHSYNTTT